MPVSMRMKHIQPIRGICSVEAAFLLAHQSMACLFIDIEDNLTCVLSGLLAARSC